jgi:hypothetical protein
MFYDGYRVEAYKAGMPGLIADVLAGALLLTPIVCLFLLYQQHMSSRIVGKVRSMPITCRLTARELTAESEGI